MDKKPEIVHGATSFQIATQGEGESRIAVFTFKMGGEFDKSSLVLGQFALNQQGVNDLAMRLNELRNIWGHLPITPQS